MEAKKLTWDASGTKKFELGVDHGVLYTLNKDWTAEDDSDSNPKWPGVAWNGLTSVSESPEGAETNDIYADNIKYGSFLSAENLKATIEAYTYPDEFMACDGSKEISYTPQSGDPVGGVYAGQQSRDSFCLVYRTQVGDDTAQEHHHKIHILYNCKASPSERAYETINDSLEAITFSWEVSCTPEGVGSTLEGMGFKATALITIDEEVVGKTKFAILEDYLFGKNPSTSSASDGIIPQCLTPEQIYKVLSTGSPR